MTHLASIGPESGIFLSPILAWLRLFLQINTGNLRGSHMVQPEWKVGAYWYRLPQSNLGGHMALGLMLICIIAFGTGQGRPGNDTMGLVLHLYLYNNWFGLFPGFTLRNFYNYLNSLLFRSTRLTSGFMLKDGSRWRPRNQKDHVSGYKVGTLSQNSITSHLCAGAGGGGINDAFNIIWQ